MISLFRRNPVREAAILAYSRVVEQARKPIFYAEYSVPDSLDGRFELICLHSFLYLHRLMREGEAGAGIGQSFFDEMFGDFDRCLREMGTGDLSVGRQVNRMAEAFYGRIKAYEEGLDAGASLEAALTRNLYGTTSADASCVTALSDYMRGQSRELGGQQASALLKGDVRFGPPPPSRIAPGSGQAA